MLISIEVREDKLPRIKLGGHDEDEGDVTAVLIDICEALADADAADFRVSGFGEDRWPVDVRTDLPVVLEQLPAAIAASTDPPSEFTLDFYEQGVERRLAFTPHAQEFTVTCQSDTDWRPEPSEEKVKVAIFRQQLVNLRDSFLRVVRSVAPELEGQKLLHTWAAESSRTE